MHAACGADAGNVHGKFPTMPNPFGGALGLRQNVQGEVKNSFTMNRVGAAVPARPPPYSSVSRVTVIDASVLVRVHSKLSRR